MVTFVLSSSPEQIPVQIRRYAIISRPDVASVKDLKGKRLAINPFGSSAGFAFYQLLSRNGLDPNKDVTLLSVAGRPDAAFRRADRRRGRCHRGEQPVRIAPSKKALRYCSRSKRPPSSSKFPSTG